MQDFLFVEEEWNEDAAKSAIAVQEWVKDFKLGMNYSQLHQPIGLFCVIIFFPIVEQPRERCGWRGNKVGLLNRRALGTNPILFKAKPSSCLILTANAVE